MSKVSWSEVTRTTEAGDRKAVWVTWSAASPLINLSVNQMDGKVEGNINALVAELDKDEKIPDWFAKCDECVFPPLGIIFLGPHV